MTGERERAVETLKENLCAMCAYGSQSMASCDIRGCDNRDAIKALEQEPVLDKIRAEIRKKMKFNCFNETYVLYDDITEVFDKYKAEGSDKK